MTIKIIYKTYCMFDIEFYQKIIDNNTYYSELDCLPCVEGLIRFVDEEGSNLDLKEFIKDATEIQELRAYLYERLNNKPTSDRNRHYNEHRKAIDQIINKFIDKYELYVNTD